MPATAVFVLTLFVLVQSVLIAALLVQRARRARAERTVRESEARFRLMADRAPVMMWTTKPDTTLDYLNRTCTEFTGLPLEQLLGNGWLDAVHPDDVEKCVSTYTPAFEARTPFRMEYRIRGADGVYRWVLDLGVPKYEPDGSFAGFVGSTIDITDRKDMENALLESQRRYALATAAGAAGVWDWNLETNDMYVDPTLKSILGYEDAEIPNRFEDWACVHGEDATAMRARLQACIDGDTPVYELEHRMWHKDGRVRWFLSRGSPIRRADGTPYRMVGTGTDVTDRKRAEEAIREKEAVLRASDRELQHLAGRLIAAQEVERARIARDLHDDTSQQLAGLAIALSGLKRRVGAVQNDGDLQADVSSLQQRTIALAENVRRLSHDLHPSVLAHAGLVAALAAYCAEVQGRQQTVEVTFSAEGDFESTDAEVALCLYRIAQESLRNVMAHAGAHRADVRLLRTGNTAELTISDDGKGFDIVSTRENRKGLGLVSINERVRLAGGTVSIATESNKGTRVRVQIPAKPHPQTAAGGESGWFVTLA